MSGRHQIKGVSLEDQEHAYRAYVACAGWDLIEPLYIEPGRSAFAERLDTRIVFQKLLLDAQQRRFDVVLVYKLNRFARNVPAQYAAAAAQARLPAPASSQAEPIFKAGDDVLPVALAERTRRRLRGRYGAAAGALVATAKEGELDPIPGMTTLWAELRWAARHERVVHLDDLLLRGCGWGCSYRRGRQHSYRGSVACARRSLDGMTGSGWPRRRRIRNCGGHTIACRTRHWCPMKVALRKSLTILRSTGATHHRTRGPLPGRG